MREDVSWRQCRTILYVFWWPPATPIVVSSTPLFNGHQVRGTCWQKLHTAYWRLIMDQRYPRRSEPMYQRRTLPVSGRTLNSIHHSLLSWMVSDRWSMQDAMPFPKFTSYVQHTSGLDPHLLSNTDVAKTPSNPTHWYRLHAPQDRRAPLVPRRSRAQG